MRYRNTADERAEAKRLRAIRTAAFGVIEQIKAIKYERDDQLAQVPPLFAALGKTDNDRYSVFRLLDEEPAGFGGHYSEWHSTLRRCRNHPVHGPQLFNAINHEGAFDPKLSPVERARLELGASHYIALWAGCWGKAETIEEAMKLAYATKPGTNVLIFPAAADGYVDDHGRVYPGLKQQRVAGFKGKVSRRAGQLSVIDQQDW
jgi:hypothetical protein